MKIRSKFILPITGLVILSVVIALIAINMTVSGLVAEQESSFVQYANDVLSSTAKARKETIYSSIDQLGRGALDMASIFSEIPDVQTAYRLASLGNMDDEADHEMQLAREQLRKVMAPYIAGYKKQTGKAALKVHFHTSNGRSLVRLWRDGWQAKKSIFLMISPPSAIQLY